MMDKEQAARRIWNTYKCYGIKKTHIDQLMNSGLEKGFSVSESYNLLRMTLGREYHEREYFSLTEVSEMLGETPETIIQAIGKQNEGKKAEVMDGIRMYFPHGLSS